MTHPTNLSKDKKSSSGFSFFGITLKAPKGMDWMIILISSSIVLIALNFIKSTPLAPANYAVVIVAALLSSMGISLLEWRKWKNIVFFFAVIIGVASLFEIFWPRF